MSPKTFGLPLTFDSDLFIAEVNTVKITPDRLFFHILFNQEGPVKIKNLFLKGDLAKRQQL